MVDAHADPLAASTSSLGDVDAVSRYLQLVSEGQNMPIAAISCLSEVIEKSSARTMSELLAEVNKVATELKTAALNPISLSAGTALLLRFITLQRPATSHRSFDVHKRDLAARARDFVSVSGRCTALIAEQAADFIEDGVTVMTHGYSRVVMRALLHASQVQRKRFTVLVAETRPFGTGLQTHAALAKASIPCTVLLDAAVAYAMSRADLVLLGAEGVCENGGLISGIGSFQMALSAHAFSKPVYGLAESYKFLRLYPLNQQDIPTLTKPLTATALRPSSDVVPGQPPSRYVRESPIPPALNLTAEMVEDQPILDYVLPELIRLVISDLSVSTPSGISDSLLTIFGGG